MKNTYGVLACITKVFGDHRSALRGSSESGRGREAENYSGTEKVKEYHLKDALRELEEMENIYEIGSVIREY